MFAVVVMILALAVRVHGQSEGNNAIYNSGLSYSTDYVDAFPFYTNDICSAINNVLTAATTSVVVDARGILPLQGGNAYLSCSANPFDNVTVPSTVLLPGQTIRISKPWVLPSNTRIIGEGTGTGGYTTIGVLSGFTIPTGSIPTMIQMGTSITSPATGVVIEHLQLNGGGITFGFFDGIDNVSAGDGSFVNDVDIIGFGPLNSSGTVTKTACTPSGISGAMTGLCIGPGATYSGPYSNLNVAPSNNCSGGSMCANTACVKIQAQTRGLHNITCVGGSNSANFPEAAIYLDSYGNTIENVHVEGFYDAIVVGDYADNQGGLQVNGAATPSVAGNTIATVTGSTSTGAQFTNTVHICKGALSTGSACSANTVQIRDLFITQALSNAPTAGTVAAIQDDIGGWTGGVNSSTGEGFVGPTGLFTYRKPKPPATLPGCSPVCVRARR
jgi:hypothetical protein